MRRRRAAVAALSPPPPLSHPPFLPLFPPRNKHGRMVESCHKACAAKPYKEGSLSVGESSCVDRCAAKYWQAVAIVGQLIGSGGGGGGQQK